MPMTNAEFAQQAAYLARNCADWAGDCLTLKDRVHTQMEQSRLGRFVTYVRSRLDSLEHAVGLRTIWNHKKRKTWHTVIGTATAQCATGPIQEGDEVYVYRGTHDDSGKLWVRKVGEFEDGRFEKVEL